MGRDATTCCMCCAGDDGRYALPSVWRFDRTHDELCRLLKFAQAARVCHNEEVCWLLQAF